MNFPKEESPATRSNPGHRGQGLARGLHSQSPAAEGHNQIGDHLCRLCRSTRRPFRLKDNSLCLTLASPRLAEPLTDSTAPKPRNGTGTPCSAFRTLRPFAIARVTLKIRSLSIPMRQVTPPPSLISNQNWNSRKCQEDMRQHQAQLCTTVRRPRRSPCQPHARRTTSARTLPTPCPERSLWRRR